MKLYKSGEIQRLAKVSRVQLVHWTENGVIIPYQDVRGRGKMRIYNKQNLIEAIICRELNRYALEIKTMRAILDQVRTPTVVAMVGRVNEPDHISTEQVDIPTPFGNKTSVPAGWVEEGIKYRLISVWEKLKSDPKYFSEVPFLVASIPGKKMVGIWACIPNQDSINVAYEVRLASKDDIGKLLALFPSSIIVNLEAIIEEAGAG